MIKDAKEHSLARNLYKSICRKGQEGINQELFKAVIFGIMGIGSNNDPHGNFCEFNKRYKVFYYNKISIKEETKASCNQKTSIGDKNKKVVQIIYDACDQTPTLTDILTVMKKIENNERRIMETKPIVPGSQKHLAIKQIKQYLRIVM